MEQIKITIADDHETFREGLIQQFRPSPRFNIIDSCKDGEHLLRSIALHQPDVAIVDLKMPVMSGIDAIKRIVADYPNVRIIVLTTYDSELMIDEALQAGAVSYVTKSMSSTELFEAIESTYRNIPYYCDLTANKLRRIINANRAATGSVTNPNYSSTELMIIKLICQDKQVADIAKELLLGKRTIEKYRANIFAKMGVHTTGGIAVFAIRNGLYHPED